ncbi:MAG: DUF4397 domain-containing protein [Gemmatimonadales bacterium]|jgi:hypothetical protein
MRPQILLVLAATVAFAACSSDDNNGVEPGSLASVRFINATGTNLDLSTNGVVSTGNSNIAFGGRSACLSVNPSSPGLVVNRAGTTTVMPGLVPAFTSGGNFTVIAFPGADGTTQFATLTNAFTPTTGSGGLRVFNAASGAGNLDAFVMRPGAALGTMSASNIGFGSGSAFFNVPAGVQDVEFTNAGTKTVALDAGNSTFTAGSNALVVIAPPAPGSTTLRAFTTTGC